MNSDYCNYDEIKELSEYIRLDSKRYDLSDGGEE